jgi:hypothetical protein
MAIDWTKKYDKYKGQWVALKNDEKTVIANGASVEEVMCEAKQKGFQNPILFRVPTKVMPYVGYSNL